MPIVEAVGVSANSVSPARKALARQIEAAMVKAIEDACAEGLRVNEDAAKIRDRMMAARAAVLSAALEPPA
jgi:hypothetical protein